MPDRQFDGQGERLTASEATHQLELDWKTSSNVSHFIAFVQGRHVLLGSASASASPMTLWKTSISLRGMGRSISCRTKISILRTSEAHDSAYVEVVEGDLSWDNYQ